MPVRPSVLRRTRMRLFALGLDGVKRLAVPGDHGVEPPLPPEGRETRTAQRPGALPWCLPLAKRNPRPRTTLIASALNSGENDRGRRFFPMTHSYRTFRAVRSVYETRGSPARVEPSRLPQLHKLVLAHDRRTNRLKAWTTRGEPVAVPLLAQSGW